MDKNHLHRAHMAALLLAGLLLCLFQGSALAAQDKLKSAHSLFKSREYAAAQETYRDIFLAEKKGPRAEEALLGSAKALFKLRRAQEAKLTIRRLQTLNPQSASLNEAYLYLGYIALSAQNPGEARTWFDRVQPPLRGKALVGTAETALKRGDAALALELLKGLGKREAETDPRALSARAMAYSMKGMHAEALAVIGKTLDAVLKEEDLRPDKAMILFKAGRLGDAERLGQTIMKNPLSPTEKRRAARILAAVYERQGRVDTALSLSLEILPYENDDELKLSIVRLYDRQEDTGNALKYLNLLKDKKLKAAEIEKRLKAIVASGEAKDAELLARYAGHIGADSPFIVEAARYLASQGKKSEGTRLLKKAVKGVAGSEASLLLAEVQISEKKYAEAKTLLTDLQIDPRFSARASYLLADLYRQEGDRSRAIQYLLKAAQRSSDPRIAARLADLYWESGARATAAAYYLKASQKGDGGAAVKAADYYYLSGKKAQALVLYKQGLALGVSDPLSLQWARYQYGKLSGDRESLNKAAADGGVVGAAAELVGREH